MLSEYRARLLHYQPFVGRRRISGSPTAADSFSYEVGDMTFLGVINREASPKQLRVSLAEHGLPTTEPVTAYDVTTRSSSKILGTLGVSLRGEEFRLFVFRRTPGPIWSNSSIEPSATGPTGVALTARGPASIGGFMDLFIPSAPLAVEIDGNNVSLQEQAAEGAYSYNPETGVLRLRYDHASPHRIVIRW
jgi:hypothetical protein